MALLQDILDDIGDVLGGMGFASGTGGWGGGYMDIANISPGDISGVLRSHFDLGTQDLPSHMFQGISSDILRSGLASTYAPQVQAKGQSLLSDLYRGMGGAGAQKAAGGFAGSGGFGQQQAAA